MNYEFGYVIAFQTKTNRGRDPGVLHPAEFLTFPELLRRFSIKGFRFWMELMARNVYTRQNDNYEIYFWILYVQNSEIRKYSLLILLLKMCWVRKLSKSEYKSNSIPILNQTARLTLYQLCVSRSVNWGIYLVAKIS